MINQAKHDPDKVGYGRPVEFIGLPYRAQLRATYRGMGMPPSITSGRPLSNWDESFLKLQKTKGQIGLDTFKDIGVRKN